MEKPFHRFTELFVQLGLPSEPESIQVFLEEHRPLHKAIPLEDAPFWSISQATLLREQIILDADWAEIVDQLNKDLR